MSHDILTLTDVRKSFGDAQIIRGVNLAIEAGERHAVIGPNGAGKSTLFHLMSGSFGIRPGFTTGDGRLVGLVADALYWLTTLNQVPAIWQSFQGSLDAAGDANAGVFVLNDPVVLGLRTFYAVAIVDAAFPSAIQYISNTHGFTIR